MRFNRIISDTRAKQSSNYNNLTIFEELIEAYFTLFNEFFFCAYLFHLKKTKQNKFFTIELVQTKIRTIYHIKQLGRN